MQQVIITCDRCGTIIRDQNRSVDIQFWRKRYNRHEDGGCVVYDLCNDCLEQFKLFMKNKPTESKE